MIDAEYRVQPAPADPLDPRRRSSRSLRRLLAPLGVLTALLAQLKWLLVPLKVLKGGPLLAPTISALLSIGAYALAFGWQFGIGLVALIFVHEMGHVVMLRRFGVRATAPIFIPFLGAFIGIRQLPRDAVMEAYVGLGGPALGTVAALAAWALYRIDGHPIWLVLAYIGVLLNLFNLLPVLPLDGGRAVSAISRWMWAVGIVGLIALMLARPNPVLVVIALFAGGELLQARRRQDIAPDYYRVPLRQRLAVSVVYFGLIVTLGVSLLQLEPLVHAGRPL